MNTFHIHDWGKSLKCKIYFWNRKQLFHMQKPRNKFPKEHHSEHMGMLPGILNFGKQVSICQIPYELCKWLNLVI